MQQTLAAFMRRPTTRADHLMRQVDEMRLWGFAWDDEEFLDGVRCVAAPVFGIERHVVGVVRLTTPTTCAPWDRLWQPGAAGRTAAHQISANLGAPAECFEGTAMREAS